MSHDFVLCDIIILFIIIIIFFLVEPIDEVTHVQKSAAYLIGLGRRGSHPTGGGGHLGKCFKHAPTYVGQCGTGTEQMGTVALSVSPQRAPQCLTH